jgi:endonuclease G
MNLQETYLPKLKEEVLARIAHNASENTTKPQNGAFIIDSYLDKYGAPEANVKRVIVVVNNSADFEDDRSVGGGRITTAALKAKLAAKGVSLIVNTHPRLKSLLTGSGVLQSAATQNFQDASPRYMLMDVAAAAVCQEEDPDCCDDESAIYSAQEEQTLRNAQAEIDAAPACPIAAASNRNTASSNANSSAVAVPGDNGNLLLGNPSGAGTASKDNYLLTRSQFVLSYNNAKGIPNWASWYINQGWITGPAKRKDNFIRDPQLTSAFNIVEGKDYKCSGFAQGHLCPSADRITTQADNDITFVMTNMIPQAPRNNSFVWLYFEAYLRKLVKQENQEVYIIAGPAGVGGQNADNKFKDKLDEKSTDGKRIEVPRYVWKIAVVLPQGDDDLNRINADTRVICVLTPNDQSANDKKWYEYRTSINELLKVLPAGYDLLSAIPNATVKLALKSKIDTITLRKSVGERVYCPSAASFTSSSPGRQGAKPQAGRPPRPEVALSVAPNPFRDDFTVRYNLEEADEVTVCLRDLQGRVLREYRHEQAQTKGPQQLLAPVKGLPPGLYLLEIRGQKHTFSTQRLLKVE